MNILVELLQHPFTHRLGWALLHSFWEGALVAIVYAVLRLALQRRSANVRYLAGCFSLLLLVAAPIATLMIVSRTSASPLHENAISIDGTGTILFGSTSTQVIGRGTSGFVLPSLDFLERIVPWLVAGWLVGVGVFSVRMLQGCWSVRGLRTRGVELLDAIWLQRLEELKDRLRISRPVQLLKSALVEVPTVVGWLRPVILLPASSLLGLAPAQLEAILAHELAHVRRHDYLVNAFQNVVETLMFYHPAVWWISRCVREEREHCCDDLVVKVCGNRVVYARALATLEELRGAMPRLAFAASGGSLLARIRRLLGLPVESGQAGWREFAGLALMGVGIILLITGACLMLAPVKYEASARIRVAHDRLERGQADALERPSVQYDPYFLQTESEIMLSEPLLNSVIDSLQLKEAWGKRYKAGEKLTTPEMLTLLRKRVSVRVVPNTGLIEVHSLDDDAEEAAKIANAIAESYRRRALEQMRDQTRMGIQAFEDQWKEQVALVAEAQANVDKLRADLKISDRDPFGSSTPTSASSGETIRQLEAALVSLDSEAVKQETQLKALKELDPQVLQQAIQTVIGPDNQLANLLEELNVAEQKVLTLDRDYSAESPMVQNAKKMVEELRRKVKERVSGIMVGLQNRLESSRAAAVALRQRLDVARQADLVAAEKDRPYYEAKQRLMELRQFRTALALKISQEQTDLMLPRSSKVEIVERATVPLQPASPNRYRASALIALGVLCSGSGFVTLRRRPAL